jgi:UDP-hydrolysing UDP-N-acetyl-D-glucosamine 2-epimerase
MKRRIAIVLTTRGNYAKMKSTMRAIARHPSLELVTIVGGGILLTRYGNHVQRIEADGFRVDRQVHFLVDGDAPVAMATSAGLATLAFADVFETLRPDVVVVIADRYEALAIALAAACSNVPIAHLEGGEVSGSVDESFRHAITKLASVHFPANQDAADRIVRLGEDRGSVVVVGSPSLDLLGELDLHDLRRLDGLQTFGVEGDRIDVSGDYVVVSQHPVVTEYEEAISQLEQTARALTELKLPAVWLWPNMDAGADGMRNALREFCRRHDGVAHLSSLPFESYAVLLRNARCFVGNSSSGIRECAFLGVPVVNIGSRQAGRARAANVLDVPYDERAIVDAARSQIAHGPYPPSQLYGNGRSGELMARTLADHPLRRQKRIAY